MNFTVSILGCGWLGLPLAELLVQYGVDVKGSTTTFEKINDLKQAGIRPFHIQCDPEINGCALEEFFNANTLVITLPFKRSFSDPHTYLTQVESIPAYIERSSVMDFVLFTSSTSIYPVNTRLAKEDDLIIPDNPRSRILLEIENYLLSDDHFDATILRFSGLYGGDRQIGRFLAGKTELSNGDQPVNLIHLDDCVSILARIILQDGCQRGHILKDEIQDLKINDNNLREEVFNASSDAHPTRCELYSQAALQMGLTPPTFQPKTASTKKIVSNEKLKARLDYRYIHPDPFEYVKTIPKST